MNDLKNSLAEWADFTKSTSGKYSVPNSGSEYFEEIKSLQNHYRLNYSGFVPVCFNEKV